MTSARITLTRDELLVILVEEGAEVIQAITKIQRFGWAHEEPGYGVNCVQLAKEIGDVLGIIDALIPDLDKDAIRALVQARQTKIARAEAVKHRVLDER